MHAQGRQHLQALADVTAVKDEHSGNVLYRVVNVQDISERKRIAGLSSKDAILQFRYCRNYLHKGKGWEENIQEVLSGIGESARTSRVYLLATAQDGTWLVSQRYEWTAPGVAAVIDNRIAKFPIKGRIRTLGTGFTQAQPPMAWFAISQKRKKVNLSSEYPFHRSCASFHAERWWGFMGSMTVQPSGTGRMQRSAHKRRPVS
jgi:hypothetical protein